MKIITKYRLASSDCQVIRKIYTFQKIVISKHTPFETHTLKIHKFLKTLENFMF